MRVQCKYLVADCATNSILRCTRHFRYKKGEGSDSVMVPIPRFELDLTPTPQIVLAAMCMDAKPFPFIESVDTIRDDVESQDKDDFYCPLICLDDQNAPYIISSIPVLSGGEGPKYKSMSTDVDFEGDEITVRDEKKDAEVDAYVGMKKIVSNELFVVYFNESGQFTGCMGLCGSNFKTLASEDSDDIDFALALNTAEEKLPEEAFNILRMAYPKCTAALDHAQHIRGKSLRYNIPFENPYVLRIRPVVNGPLRNCLGFNCNKLKSKQFTRILGKTESAVIKAAAAAGSLTRNLVAVADAFNQFIQGPDPYSSSIGATGASFRKKKFHVLGDP